MPAFRIKCPIYTLGAKHMQLISSHQGENHNPRWVKFLEAGPILNMKCWLRLLPRSQGSALGVAMMPESPHTEGQGNVVGEVVCQG